MSDPTAPLSDGAGPPLAIQVTAVRKAFGQVTALAGVDLAVETGTLTALLGPNGAGKPNLGNWQFFLPARKDPLAGRNG